MEELKLLRTCDLCEKSGENLSLLSSNHKEKGWIKVCRECWNEMYKENRIVAGSGGSGKNAGSPCSSCPSRCY